MTGESAGSATPGKKRGPKSRAEIEAELRVELEAQIRAEVAEETKKKEREAEEYREAAAEVRPLPASAVDGDPSADGAVTIHFVDDGFTILGRTWLRGEELTLVPGTEQWNLTVINGKPLVELDEYEQERIWGKRIFRGGVWRGLRWDEAELAPLGEGEDPSVLEKEREALKKAQAERDERYGSVAR